MGRFINSDSLEYLGDGAELSNYNLFAYCGNNPVMGDDPEGTFWDRLKAVGEAFVKAAIVVAAVGSAALTIAAAVTGTVTTGGAGAIAIPAAIAVAAECLAVATSAVALVGSVAVVAGTIGDNVTYAKPSKKSQKEASTDKPSWVNKDMVDPNLSSHENATNILNQKYGDRPLKKGPNSEYNKIQKWLVRSLGIK